MDGVLNIMAIALEALIAHTVAAPPSDAGEALLVAANELIIGAFRQGQILGMTERPGTLVDVWKSIVHYLAKLMSNRCSSSTPTSSILLASYSRDSMEMARQAEIGRLADSADENLLNKAAAACWERVSFAVTFSDDASENDGVARISLTASADFELKATPWQMTSGPGETAFTFSDDSISASDGGTVTDLQITSMTGGIAAGFSSPVDPTSQLECVGSELKFVRSAVLLLDPRFLITDVETYSGETKTDPPEPYINSMGAVGLWDTQFVKWDPGKPPKWYATLDLTGGKKTWKGHYAASHFSGTWKVTLSATAEDG